MLFQKTSIFIFLFNITPAPNTKIPICDIASAPIGDPVLGSLFSF